MAVANVKIKEKKATAYFQFIPAHKYSDVAGVELQASRDTDLDDADTLIEYGAIDEDAIVYESYPPEQALEALKKFIELVENNWQEVELKFELNDKDTKSYSYFIITARSWLGRRKEVTFGIGTVARGHDGCE